LSSDNNGRDIRGVVLAYGKKTVRLNGVNLFGRPDKCPLKVSKQVYRQVPILKPAAAANKRINEELHHH